MKKRKDWKMLLVLLSGLWGLCGCGQAEPAAGREAYPLEAVELIAPAGPGSGYDLTIRSMAQCLKSTGLAPVPLPVTNKPGGGGSVSLGYLDVNRGRDDVLSIFSPPVCLINLNGTTKLNYKDNTTPIAMLVVDYGCFAVRADSPYENLNQVMEQLKKEPRSLRIGGTSSEGSMDHIQFLKIAGAAGVGRLKEIPYEGFENGGAVAQLMGDRVDVLSAGVSDVVGLMESGDVRVLAVTSDERLEGDVISGIPTCREQGIDAGFSTWRGLFGPKDMPDYAVEYWENTLEEMVGTSQWSAICEKYGWTMEYEGHEEFGKFLDEVNQEYAVLLEEIGILKADVPR